MISQQTQPNSAKTTPNYVQWFRAAAPYINSHQGKVFVVAFDGEAVNSATFNSIIHDIALLKSLGVKLVLVHGARPQIDANLAKQGLDTPMHNHMRVTTPESLRCVLDAVGSTRLEIEARLSMGLANSPMYGARIDTVSGNFIIAKPFGVRDGVDHEMTGAVRSVDTHAIKKCLKNDQVVLLGPIGYSTTGEVFNLLAEQVAVKTAIALTADKLIFMGEMGELPAHMQANRSNTGTGEAVHLPTAKQAGAAQRELLPPQALAHAQQAGLSVDLKRHLIGGAKACQQGVERAHIISYLTDGALLTELFTRDGCGILVSADKFEDFYPASFDDIGGLLELLAPLEDKGVLIRRSRQTLENNIAHYTVIKRDGMVVGCAALYAHGAQDATADGEASTLAGEIGSIAIHPSYRGQGRGERLLKYLEQKAAAMGLSQVFVLTTQTAHWFVEQGYLEGGVDDLPTTKQQNYNTGRASKVYVKQL